MAKIIVLGVTAALLAEALTQNPDVVLGELNELLNANDKLTQDNESLTKVNKNLSAKLSAAKNTDAAKPAGKSLEDYSFETEDGSKYGFRFASLQLAKGNVVTPVEVIADAEIQKHLIAIGSAMIYKKD